LENGFRISPFLKGKEEKEQKVSKTKVKQSQAFKAFFPLEPKIPFSFLK